tara:strand:+ start:540 stop:695 length:156 start_codon:yes stop_codon:yes gene_type:complete
MKLQKQKTDYKRGYHKYVVVIPNDVVEKSKLKEGDELEAKGEKNIIKLKKK